LRLTRHTDYAFRMLIHVATRAPELTTVGEVAEDFSLSATHLSKVAQTLAAHGYLETVRGRSGGLRVPQAPSLIRLGEVARATEPDFQIAPCMAEDGECPIYDPCVLRGALNQATDAFIAELNKWTLADLVKPKQKLVAAILAAQA
jgi:Rrf2 family nitric oxide-sensitive transcriptional repressor